MYLDPGFGSMIIQVLIALLASFGAYIIIIRKKIISFFSKKNKTSPAELNSMEIETENKND